MPPRAPATKARTAPRKFAEIGRVLGNRDAPTAATQLAMADRVCLSFRHMTMRAGVALLRLPGGVSPSAVAQG
jgi:ribosomal 50S subunit-recycling heat shock protein